MMVTGPQIDVDAPTAEELKQLQLTHDAAQKQVDVDLEIEQARQRAKLQKRVLSRREQGHGTLPPLEPSIRSQSPPPAFGSVTRNNGTPASRNPERAVSPFL